MENERLKNEIYEILKKDARLWDNDLNEFNQTLLLDLIDNYDNYIIKILLENENIKEKFFVNVNDVLLFKTNHFKFFIEENKVDNSFTQYKRQIGLSDGKRFLKESNDIVLNWPFKDCVLQGGQSTEEGLDTYFEYEEEKEKTINKTKCIVPAGYKEKQAKRKEIFFNEILAKDEIDRLFDEKALVNWKRYTKNGEEEVKEIKRNEQGIINENMIIKGNNLLALHTLKKQFTGKIKLIYIDPPYNTGGDANIFTYNNTFNHSSWLTFIKNRLEIAKELLRDDGFIAIAIDHFELGYLIVLTDEVFNKENRLGIISILHNPEGRQNAKYFTVTNEFLLVYRKTFKAQFNSVYLQENFKDSKNIDLVYDKKDEKGFYKEESFIRTGGGDSCLRKNKPNGWYSLYVSKDLKDISLNAKQNYIEVLPVLESGQERTWKLVANSFIEKFKCGDIYAKYENGKIKIYEKYRIDKGSPITTCWINKKYNAKKGGTSLLENIFGSKLFSYPKSLSTVQDILKIMTSDSDIILDFFAGSGTTGHATFAFNKEEGSNRKFIIIEQINEHIKIFNERNQKVLALENIDDSFIYFELAKWNETAKEKILGCESIEELEEFFNEMYEKYFLNYNFKIKEFKEKVIKEKEFRELTLEERKTMFLKMLDLNQLYVCKSEMSDKKFGISEAEQELTAEFYK